MESGVLQWSTTDFIKKAFVDSFMIKYLKSNCNLLTFEVVKGLVSKQSVKGEYLLNKYVKTLFAEKAQQDILKITNEHNPAYRETIKLFLNAVTGKFVENVDLYEDNVFTIKATKSIKSIGKKTEVSLNMKEYL